MKVSGPTMAPMNAFMTLTGIETLHLRMERHCSNAMAIAKHLEAHPEVEWVEYPGLESSKYHALADKVLSGGYGAILTFGIRGGRDAGQAFISNLELFSHLANIGDAKSLAIHPSTTTHSQLNDEELSLAGVTPEMVRLSVGIENVEDLIADLDQAIAKATAGVGAPA